MHPPPLLLDRSPGAQLVIAVVVPIAFGALTGLALGWNETLYVVLSLLGILGGIGAGYEHHGSDEGSVRGFCGGLLFGTFILLAHELSGEEATAHLPEPAGVLVVVTTVLGIAFGAIGGTLRARRDGRGSAATA